MVKCVIGRLSGGAAVGQIGWLVIMVSGGCLVEQGMVVAVSGIW